ncbi:MAG: CYTH domain-containing protein [Cyclobacteriaceae bacterium]
MSKEIERKFLLQNAPETLQEKAQKVFSIRQGYITPPEAVPQVRVRSKGDKFFLTVKGQGTLERDEAEIELSEVQFQVLWPLTEGRRLSKTRYELPYQQLTIEVDIFEEALQGLMLAEVEFSSVEAGRSFQAPEWMGREVTEDERFTNSHLAASQLVPLMS